MTRAQRHEGEGNQEPQQPPGLHIKVFYNDARGADELDVYKRTVRVGWAPGNTVVLPDDNAPKSVPLFHRHGDSYSLHYTDETSGAVARGEGAPWYELSEMHMSSTESGDGYDLDLHPGAQGRVDVGKETLAFEVMAKPPTARPRPRWYAMALLAAVTIFGGVLWFTLASVESATGSIAEVSMLDVSRTRTLKSVKVQHIDFSPMVVPVE